MIAEVPKYKMITVSILSDRLRINCSLARKALGILTARLQNLGPPPRCPLTCRSPRRSKGSSAPSSATPSRREAPRRCLRVAKSLTRSARPSTRARATRERLRWYCCRCCSSSCCCCTPGGCAALDGACCGVACCQAKAARLGVVGQRAQCACLCRTEWFVAWLVGCVFNARRALVGSLFLSVTMPTYAGH